MAELQIGAETGPQVAAVQRVLELALASVPVPIEREEGDPVLDRLLDLPVHDRRVTFRIIAEERHSFGKGVKHLPLLTDRPAWKVVDAHLVRAGGDRSWTWD